MTAPAATRVVVVGGGITGLAAALQAVSRDGVQVEVLDAASRAGGLVATHREGGFLLEEGPDAFITDKPAGLALVRSLGLQDDLIGTQARHRRSFVVRRGRLLPTPAGFQVLAPGKLAGLLGSRVLGLTGKVRAALEPLVPRRREEGDESIARFVRRRYGAQVYARLAQPMLSAIYGADPERLSLAATFPRFPALEQAHGSVTRGLRRSGGSGDQEAQGARYGLFASLRPGLGRLVEAILERLPEGCVRTGTAVTAIARTQGGRWSLITAQGPLEADAVIVALPAPRAAEVLVSLDEELARQLRYIRYGSSATVTVTIRAAQVRHGLDGFGFVVPAAEGMSLLGCSFSHRKFPGRAPEGSAILRAFHGEASAHLGDADLEEATLRDLRRLVGLAGKPAGLRVTRYREAMPAYAVGHLELVREIQSRVEGFPGLALAGNAYGGVGLPDCIRSGQRAAERVLRPAAGG